MSEEIITRSRLAASLVSTRDSFGSRGRLATAALPVVGLAAAVALVAAQVPPQVAFTIVTERADITFVHHNGAAGTSGSRNCSAAALPCCTSTPTPGPTCC